MPQDTAATTLWTSCARQLRTQVSDTVWSTIFNELVVIDLRDDVLRLGVPSMWHRERLEGRYFGLFDSALADSEAAHVSVQFEIQAQPPTSSDDIADPAQPTNVPSAADDETMSYDPNTLAEIDLTTSPPGVTFARPESAAQVEAPIEKTSQPFTFDDFVIGPKQPICSRRGTRRCRASSIGVQPALYLWRRWLG